MCFEDFLLLMLIYTVLNIHNPTFIFFSGIQTVLQLVVVVLPVHYICKQPTVYYTLCFQTQVYLTRAEELTALKKVIYQFLLLQWGNDIHVTVCSRTYTKVVWTILSSFFLLSAYLSVRHCNSLCLSCSSLMHSCFCSSPLCIKILGIKTFSLPIVFFSISCCLPYKPSRHLYICFCILPLPSLTKFSLSFDISAVPSLIFFLSKEWMLCTCVWPLHNVRFRTVHENCSFNADGMYTSTSVFASVYWYYNIMGIYSLPGIQGQLRLTPITSRICGIHGHYLMKFIIFHQLELPTYCVIKKIGRNSGIQ